MNKQHIKFIVLACAIALVGQSCNSVSDGGFFRSEDVAETWEQKILIGQDGRRTLTISDIDVRDIAVDPEDHNIIYLSSQTGLYKTENRGENWYQLPLRAEPMRDIAIDPKDTNNIYSVRDRNILRSQDAGNNWEIVYTDAEGVQITRVEVDWFNTNRIIATTNVGTVIISDDYGVSWQTVLDIKDAISEIGISQQDSRVMYISVLDEAVYKSIDGGLTWDNLFEDETEDGGTKDIPELRDFKGMDQVKRLYIDVNDGNTVYVVTNHGIMITEDGGESWSLLETLIVPNTGENIQVREVTTIPGEPDTILFSLGRLVHKSVDNGETWKTIEDFPSVRNVMALDVSIYVEEVLIEDEITDGEEVTDETTATQETTDITDTTELAQEEQPTVQIDPETGAIIPIEETEEEEPAYELDGVVQLYEVGVTELKTYTQVYAGTMTPPDSGGFFGGPPAQ